LKFSAQAPGIGGVLTKPELTKPGQWYRLRFKK